MPCWIKAGVFGMARTTFWIPSQRARSSARIPAAIETSNCPLSNGASCCDTSRNCCGFTASTMISLPVTAAASSAVACTPNSCCSLARLSALISTTRSCAAEKSRLSNPPMRAVAILPPPMNVMIINLTCFRNRKKQRRLPNNAPQATLQA